MLEQTLYLFIDESGNLDFSPTGTKYFVLTSIATLSPQNKRDALHQLRYSLIGETKNNRNHFHATEDRQEVRDMVFDIIENLDDFEIDSVIAQKNKSNTFLHTGIVADPTSALGFDFKKMEEKFYKQISETLLQYVVRRYVHLRTSHKITKVVVYMDALFTKSKQDFVTKHLKQYFIANFNLNPYVFFCPSINDINCQIVDYCGWAIYVKWERGELRPYKKIKTKVKSEFDIFASGTTTYY